MLALGGLVVSEQWFVMKMISVAGLLVIWVFDLQAPPITNQPPTTYH
jgi:hypothetical protein